MWADAPEILTLIEQCHRSAIRRSPYCSSGRPAWERKFWPAASIRNIAVDRSCRLLNQLLRHSPGPAGIGAVCHEKGAFTGASAMKQGKFELAAGGVLLLDEIGEMDFSLQSKLLRVLEEREFERIGGTRTIPLTAKIIASTNENLKQMARKRNSAWFVLPPQHLRDQYSAPPRPQAGYSKAYGSLHADRCFDLGIHPGRKGYAVPLQLARQCPGASERAEPAAFSLPQYGH